MDQSFISIERLKMSEGEVKKVSRQDIQLVSIELKSLVLCIGCTDHLNEETWPVRTNSSSDLRRSSVERNGRK